MKLHRSVLTMAVDFITNNIHRIDSVAPDEFSRHPQRLKLQTVAVYAS